MANPLLAMPPAAPPPDTGMMQVPAQWRIPQDTRDNTSIPMPTMTPPQPKYLQGKQIVIQLMDNSVRLLLLPSQAAIPAWETPAMAPHGTDEISTLTASTLTMLEF